MSFSGEELLHDLGREVCETSCRQPTDLFSSSLANVETAANLSIANIVSPLLALDLLREHHI